MDDVERIVDELRRAFEGEAWHGPALMEVFGGVDATAAASLPDDGGPSIWQIALHLGVWIEVVRRHLDGEPIPDLAPEEDWPPLVEGGEEAWRATLAGLRESDRRLREALASWPAEQVDVMVPGKPYTYGVMLHGIAQHNAYHAGQVALRKRAFAARS